MSKSKKLIFFGNERLATGVSTTAPVLRSLVAAGYDIEAVIANHQDPVSRQKRGLEIGLVAQKYKIPVILPGKNIPLAQKLKKYQAAAAVLVAFGQIIPKEVIDMFPAGIINIHPSLLPKLRGPTPVETAIMDNLDETGVSLMKISEKMDAGPVYAQEKLALNGHETKFELADRLNYIGANLLVKHLGAILDGDIKPKPQDNSQATYTKMLSKSDGIIDFDKQPAELIERRVRAYQGYPKTRAILYGNEVVLTAVRLAEGKGDGGLVVKCKSGFLEIQELIAPSGRTMSGADFLRGYAKR